MDKHDVAAIPGSVAMKLKSIVVPLALSLPAGAQVVNPDNGHIYMLTSGPMCWLEARAEAAAMGGYLASITDPNEQQFVVSSFFAPGKGLYIGLSDELQEGTWVWDSGEPFSFSAWYPGEPNSITGPAEDYGEIWSSTINVSGLWNDIPDCPPGGPWCGIIEIPPTGVVYCTAGASASGCQTMISAYGTPSTTNSSGFSLVASTVEGVKDGIFFYGVNGRQATPWGTGYQCVVPPVRRAGLMQGIGTGGGCDGTFSLDLNARWTAIPQHNPGAGAVVQAQLWYRDPWNTATNKTTTLSDAIEFTVGP